MTMLPALNVTGMRDGPEALFGKGYDIFPIWKGRMDSRIWAPTPNADVIARLRRCHFEGLFSVRSLTY